MLCILSVYKKHFTQSETLFTFPSTSSADTLFFTRLQKDISSFMVYSNVYYVGLIKYMFGVRLLIIMLQSIVLVMASS